MLCSFTLLQKQHLVSFNTRVSSVKRCQELDTGNYIYCQRPSQSFTSESEVNLLTLLLRKVGKWGPSFIQPGSSAKVNNVSLALFIMLGFSIFLLCQRNIIEIMNITIAYHLSNASKLRSYGWTCNYTFCYYYRISLEKHWVLTLESILSQPDTAGVLNLAQPSI